MATNLIKWLESCGCHDVRPCRVTIGSETWEGAYYKRTLQYGNCDAVRWGLKKPEDTYTRESIYCVGNLPKGYKPKRSNKVCYPSVGFDWYIACYLNAPVDDERMAQYHPFGLSFILMPWDIDTVKIDSYEPKPYKRIPLQVDFLQVP